MAGLSSIRPIMAAAWTCAAIMIALPNAALAAQTDKVLYAFKGTGQGDGASPYGGVIDKAHNFYGVTLFGGGSCDCGTVYKLAPDGTETVLHIFAGGSDGSYPYEDRLVLDGSGNLYGTAEIGGGSGCGGSGCGVIFKIASDGTETILYPFTGGTDGGDPVSGLTVDASGNLYGTTSGYGAHRKGTVYEFTTGGVLTTLYAFCALANCTDGATPDATPTLDNAGDVYGTTVLGGTDGKGTVWKLTSGGAESVLYSFCSQQNCADGASPTGGVSLYQKTYVVGVTPYGGSTACSQGCGVGFEVNTSGGEAGAYPFCSQTNCADGSLPHATPIIGTDGTLYGAATGGGRYGYGVIYKFTVAGKLGVLYNFAGGVGGPDGAAPYGSLYMDKKGRIYGTTVDGGSGDGTVFKLGR